MKKRFLKLQILTGLLILFTFSSQLQAQTLEWRLTEPTYHAADPDGNGPATGSTTFTLQMHTVSGTVNDVNTISIGWSYRSSKAMVPATEGCSVVSSPANVTLSPDFITAGFAYTVANQCDSFSQVIDGQTFDRRVVGTLDGRSINITPAWVDVFTVTLWNLGTPSPALGFVALNSGAGGTPGAFPGYAVADLSANEYVVNSLSFATPLLMGSGTLPVALTRDLSVYPVPARNVFNIILAAEKNNKATIKLFDIMGRVYRVMQTDVLQGSNRIVVNVDGLVAGQYILRVEVDNAVKTRKVLIE
jgi:hypothetical protein